jgi:adenylate cyclase
MRDSESREPAETGAEGQDADEKARTMWHQVLVDGYEPLRRAHRMFRHLPGMPRCKMCHNPFGGLGGRVVGLMGFKPSRKNPNLCARCCDSLPRGGIELDTAVLFADVRGSTALSRQIDARAFAALMNHFYRTTTNVLIRHDAIIDKLIGDEVMAFFVPGIAGAGYRRQAATAAIELLEAMSGEPALPVGAAVNAGVAYVGNVGADRVMDFTALGDPVNLAARLQAQAAAGEVVMAADLYVAVSDRFPDAEARTLTVRGHETPIGVRVVRVAA